MRNGGHVNWNRNPVRLLLGLAELESVRMSEAFIPRAQWEQERWLRGPRPSPYRIAEEDRCRY